MNPVDRRASHNYVLGMRSSEESTARISAALQRIKSWMVTAGADVLVNNLAKGSTAETLAECARTLGHNLPPDLVALWSIHAGQNDEQNGFVGAMDLLGPDEAVAEREDVLMFLNFLRKDPSEWAAAGITKAEAESDAWVPLAARGYADKLVVSGVSGRVFACEKDSPPFHLVAASVVEWIEKYAERVESGEYKVEEGFGDCYLANDDTMY